MTHLIKTKICGLKTIQDAAILNEYRPDYAGVIVAEGFGRSIDKQNASAIKNALHPNIALVGVFYNDTIDKIMQFADEGIIDIIQLHGDESEDFITTLRHKTTLPIWRAFKINKHSDFGQINRSNADLVLLDAGTGCGCVFDWQLVNLVDRAYILAGGLNDDNIADALQLSPYGVDVSSGVESNKQKDKNKIANFLQKVKNTHPNQ